MLQPGVVRQESDPPSLKSLVMDPYIIVAAGETWTTCCVCVCVCACEGGGSNAVIDYDDDDDLICSPIRFLYIEVLANRHKH
jgi:hypothetical protein